MRVVVGLALVVLALGATARVQAAPPEAGKLYAAGKYAETIAAARAALADGEDWDWRALLVRALVATGQRVPATQEVAALNQRYPGSYAAKALAHEVYLAAGDPVRAAEIMGTLRAATSAPGAEILDCDDLVAAGIAALDAGDEPKKVLASYFDEAQRREPNCKSAYLAAGTLALDKHDDALAAESFQHGIERAGPDPDLYAGLARAFRAGDRQEMTAAIDAALAINPRHAGALLARAEHEIDAEDYAGARATLDKVHAVDADQPFAWAFRAVLAHLQHEPKAEADATRRALTPRANHPAVVSLIGRKLSEKYRFREGAAYQRRALAMDEDYLPAKARLAHDLLRLGGPGDEKTGWALAEEVHRKDGYDVSAYNLTTLHQHLRGFHNLTGQGGSRGFVVRMEPREARIYGDDVLALLGEASRALDGKYGWKRSSGTVAVEIFPDQADFAVRTFGMPGGSGYLGVCFGPLITMNSPAGTGSGGVNWRSILWHEYTHVITLGLTGNRIPRWLSEGISVFEEMRRDRNWGQRMTPRFRQMIVEGELTPVGKLSGAFLNPKTPEHVIFAYYQSALVVEFLVERHGAQALRAVLTDLGAGVNINAALAARTAPLETLEKDFAAFARARADQLAPGADFSDPEGEGSLAKLLGRKPKNIPALLEEARRLVDEGKWAEAKPLLERAIALYPDNRGADNPYLMLALVQRKLGAPAEERRTLEQLAAIAADAATAYRRLIELAENDQGAPDTAALLRNGERLLGVNPLAEAAWRAIARAHESEAERDGSKAARAAVAYEKLLVLEPADQADVRFRLAKLYRRDRPAQARRHLLDALAEAPRRREGYQLLRALRGGAP